MTVTYDMGDILGIDETLPSDDKALISQYPSYDRAARSMLKKWFKALHTWFAYTGSGESIDLTGDNTNTLEHIVCIRFNSLNDIDVKEFTEPIENQDLYLLNGSASRTVTIRDDEAGTTIPIKTLSGANIVLSQHDVMSLKHSSVDGVWYQFGGKAS